MSGAPHPVGKLPGVLKNVCFLKDTALQSLGVPWPRCQDLDKLSMSDPTKDDLVLAVSHAWAYQVHPDPLGEKSPYIQELSTEAVTCHKPRGNTLLFFDLLSVPQRPFAVGQAPRTKAQDEQFAIGLKAFPQIYLMADATIHLDIPLSAIEGDGEAYSVPLLELDRASLQAVGPSVQVMDAELPLPDSPTPVPFDFVERVNGTPIDSMQALDRARAAGATQTSPSFFWCSMAPEPKAELRKAPFGKRNLLSANVKGWIYLERFASMVKVAMTHESQVEGLVLSNSQEVRDQIFKGGARLRAAVASGGVERLKEVLDSFSQELNEKQFSAMSIDKQKNTGGMGGVKDVNADAYAASDRDVVWALMQEMVDYLVNNWASEQRAQEHRQLVLAVGRQDAEGLSKLLGARAEPNTQDAQGWTVLHEAAKIKNLDVIKVLLEHGADPQCKDKQGGLPAHRVMLLQESTTIPAFQLLTPSRKELEHKNAAGVSPLERFAGWARTAAEGAPFPPAQEVVDNLVRTYPGVLEEEATDEASDDELASKDIVEKLEHCEIGGRKVAMRTWEHKDGGKHHVLYLAFASFVPASLEEEAVRAMAPKICGRYSVRLHMIDYTALAPAMYTADMGDVIASMCELIEELPLNPKFVLWDNSSGLLTPLVWRLRHRLVGAMVLNFCLYFSDDFEDTEGFNKVMGMAKMCGDMFEGRQINKLSGLCSAMAYASRPEKMEPIQRAYEKALESAGDVFWDFNCGYFVRGPMFVTEFFRKFPALHEPMQDMPVGLICGDQAPDLIYMESTQRLRSFVPWVETLGYVNKSKTLWQIEGKRQIAKVAELLGKVVGEAYGITPVEPNPRQAKQLAEPGPSSPAALQTKQQPTAKASQQQCCVLQ